MGLRLQLMLLVAGILHTAQGQSSPQPKSTFDLLTAVLVVTGILGLLLLYDRRQDYAYLRTIRGRVGEWIVSMRRRKKHRKIQELTEEIEGLEVPATPKNNQIFDHQKTYVDAELPNSPNAQLRRAEEVLHEEITPDTPKPDFKGVFQVKESKCKHKVNKKSKSKLKGRLMGKASDDGEQMEGVEVSGLMEEEPAEVSKDQGSQTDDYKNIEVLE